MGFRICALVLVLQLLTGSSVLAQEFEFSNLVKNLLEGDELKNIQNVYSALPVELRDKLTKDLLANPGKVGKDLVNMLGPQVQNLIAGFAGNFGKTLGSNNVDNNIGSDRIQMDYHQNGQRENQKPSSPGGFDFGPMASMMGNLISSNPQMLLSMAQGFLQNNGNSFSFDSIASMVTEKFDLDTVLSMASAFGIGLPSDSAGSRGEGDTGKAGQGIADMLRINEAIKMWQDFVRSPLGQKLNRVLPRLLKAETLPDALRLLEKETAFRFDVILLQLQEPTIRKMFVAQTVKPIGKFFKGITIPKDLKEVLTKADDILNTKLGLGVRAKEFIEPTFNYIRDTFKITRESLLDLKPEDVEKIASEVLNNEVLAPLTFVWDAYNKARENTQCAQFIFCQLNYNFHQDNFIKRNVIKTSSIVSAFQASALLKGKDAFSLLYEAAYKGADGSDCTMGVNSFCLELMHTAAHNEL